MNNKHEFITVAQAWKDAGRVLTVSVGREGNHREVKFFTLNTLDASVTAQTSAVKVQGEKTGLLQITGPIQETAQKSQEAVENFFIA